MRKLLLHNSIQTRKNTNFRSFLQPKNGNYLQPKTVFKQKIVFISHKAFYTPQKPPTKNCNNKRCVLHYFYIDYYYLRDTSQTINKNNKYHDKET